MFNNLNSGINFSDLQNPINLFNFDSNLGSKLDTNNSLLSDIKTELKTQYDNKGRVMRKNNISYSYS